MKKNLTFTLIIWLLIFAIFEIGFRSYDYIRKTREVQSKYTLNPASIFVPHPFAAYAANPAHSDHNAQGYRTEKSKFYEADSNSINIVCLGGSSTYGTRVLKEDSYPYLLEKELSKYIDKKINVINGGLGGYSTPNIISLLSLKFLQLVESKLSSLHPPVPNATFGQVAATFRLRNLREIAINPSDDKKTSAKADGYSFKRIKP